MYRGERSPAVKTCLLAALSSSKKRHKAVGKLRNDTGRRRRRSQLGHALSHSAKPPARRLFAEGVFCSFSLLPSVAGLCAVGRIQLRRSGRYRSRRVFAEMPRLMSETSWSFSGLVFVVRFRIVTLWQDYSPTYVSHTP